MLKCDRCQEEDKSNGFMKIEYGMDLDDFEVLCKPCFWDQYAYSCSDCVKEKRPHSRYWNGAVRAEDMRSQCITYKQAECDSCPRHGGHFAHLAEGFSSD